MMIRTAGGPGLVSPIDFHERKGPKLSRSAWIAIGLVATAHIGVGVALYYQRFEMKLPPIEETPPMTGPIITLEPPPKPKPVESKPAAENPPIHHPDAPPTTIDVLKVPINPDAKPTTGPTISFPPVEHPTPEAPPAREPVAEPPPARVIRNPSWVRQPTAEQMMRAYPDRAIAAGTAGSVSLNCLVEANGSVSDCAVAGETPAGQGFGRAAQNLSRHFRVSPRTVDGAPEGSRVAINLRFVPPAE